METNSAVFWETKRQNSPLSLFCNCVDLAGIVTTLTTVTTAQLTTDAGIIWPVIASTDRSADTNMLGNRLGLKSKWGGEALKFRVMLFVVHWHGSKA